MSEFNDTSPNSFEWPEDERRQVPGGYDGTYETFEQFTKIPRGAAIGHTVTQHMAAIE